MAYKVGDKVEVKYLGARWLTVTVAEVRTLSEEAAAEAREFYPNVRAGDELLICACGGGDTRGFLPGHDSLRRPGEGDKLEPAAAPPSGIRVSTPLKLRKNPSP